MRLGPGRDSWLVDDHGSDTGDNMLCIFHDAFSHSLGREADNCPYALVIDILDSEIDLKSRLALRRLGQAMDTSLHHSHGDLLPQWEC